MPLEARHPLRPGRAPAPQAPGQAKPGTSPAVGSAGQACGSKRFDYVQRAWICSSACWAKRSSRSKDPAVCSG